MFLIKDKIINNLTKSRQLINWGPHECLFRNGAEEQPAIRSAVVFIKNWSPHQTNVCKGQRESQA